jgi:alkylation response protein AidB-like acyl-CoA dehydrogenase
MLSGIGPADLLRNLGIPVVLDQPEVGQNLQDHALVPLVFTHSHPISLLAANQPEHVERFMLHGRGPLTANGPESGGFACTDDDLPAPNVEFLGAPVMFADSGLAPPIHHSYSFGPSMLTPRSRGYVALASDEPTAKPRIVHNYFADPADLDDAVEATRLSLRIARQKALAPYTEGQYEPPASESDADLRDYIRLYAHSIFHAAGTCAMGRVVDADLRVLGVPTLRVVDASVMPTLVRGNPNAPTIAIAEKAADLVRGVTPPRRQTAVAAPRTGVSMTTTTRKVPPAEELVRRTAELVPLLRKHAPWQEENRRLHDEAVEALADIGFFKMRVPVRYGGYESDTRTLNRVLTELGRGDGSVAWTASVWAIPGWMVGMFPDQVQEEVYATPDVRVCGTLSPSAEAKPTKGGIVVNGRWSFISGAHHSHWQEVLAMAPTPDGKSQWPVMALVPMSDLEVVDDWHTSGLRGSGSVTTVAKDVFVPEERVLPMVPVLQGQTASPRNAKLSMYRCPLVAVANASTVGMVVGLARAAQDAFFERLGGRKITYTNYESQREAPVTHLQVAEAALKVDQAEFHAGRATELVDTKGASGEEWTIEERARTRADVGVVCQLGKAAVDVLALASGGSSIYNDVPIQRIVRDMHAVNMHALTVPDTNFELYGRVLCGLEPNTLYI